MERFYKMAEASNKRFPEGVHPFQMATRLLEECGEVAAEINHWENSGLKRQKLGEPKKEYLANELRQTITELIKIAVYYSVESELEESINQSLIRSRNEGLID
jgi:NTP pyrophosphatase (non-canonical NTP hydrolase)